MNNSPEFMRGAMTFFTALATKASNNFHANLELSTKCEEENRLVIKERVQY